MNFGLFCSGFYVMGEEGVVCWQMMVAAFDLGGWKDEMKNDLGVLLKSHGNFLVTVLFDELEVQAVVVRRH